MSADVCREVFLLGGQVLGVPVLISPSVLPSLPFSAKEHPKDQEYVSWMHPKYPLVNIQKTMENHNFSWVNPYSYGHFQ
jgi:hypothetical protein